MLKVPSYMQNLRSNIIQRPIDQLSSMIFYESFSIESEIKTDGPSEATHYLIQVKAAPDVSIFYEYIILFVFHSATGEFIEVIHRTREIILFDRREGFDSTKIRN